MSRSFNLQLEQHGAWRRNFAHRLKWLANWLRENDLLDEAVTERMRELDAQMRASKVMVAFVAEYSRGKSELINAIFFAGYGRRIMPASAGRTTMCPTELGYDPELPHCLRLLPIETRLEPYSLVHWRKEPHRWAEFPIDVDDAQTLASTMRKVAEVKWVPQAEARSLGFWSDEYPEDNPVPDAKGRVEVPCWRHAVLNMPHPLFEQGLVILDTPGLNAIGAEPELTVSLIPQAHAVVFILGVDTGVTRSDLDIWREHLATDVEGGVEDTRIVVLNKIDTLWDILSSPAEVDAQVQRQRVESAKVLGVPIEHVLPVSAQKGLQAKIRRDTPLLEASRLPALETVLGEGLLGRRETVLRLAVNAAVSTLQTEVLRIIKVRQRGLAEQTLELQGLRGKNTSVIRHMRMRIESEQTEFEGDNSRITNLRSVHSKLLRDVLAVLGSNALKADMARLADALKRRGVKLKVHKIYGATFNVLRNNLHEVQATTNEIQAMLSATFRQLNAEQGFNLLAPPEPDLEPFVQQLNQIERSHMRYLGVGNVLRLTRPEFCDKLVRALTSRLRSVNEAAMAEVERWTKSASAQLDAQLRERRRHYDKRIESIERIQSAASSLDERLHEIVVQQADLAQIEKRLRELTAAMLATQEPSKAPAKGRRQSVA